MKILVVDDEKYALLSLKNEILKSVPNADIDCFLSPTEALSAAESTKYDIAFSDIKMPEIHGIDFAKALKKINPLINIIFVTGYNEYMSEAIMLHASGYVLKPANAEDITIQIDNLLHPVEIPKKVIYANTFGDFELFVNGNPVHFTRSKCKELLAYLIDRNGASVSKKQAAAVMFEDGDYSLSRQSYFSKIATLLLSDLKAVGAEKMLRKEFGQLSIDTTTFECDAYSYLKGNIESVNRFRGEYMEQYSWAEYSKGKFYK